MAHEKKLLVYAQEKMQGTISGLRMIGTAENKGSIISFVMDKVHPHDLATILDRQGVAIRAGHHCTMPLMKRFNVPATARVSMAFYNTLDEIDQCIVRLISSEGYFLMMHELRELYQDVIIEHGSNPRHFCTLNTPTCIGHGYNPLCGDQITLELKINQNTLSDMGFQGQGCAISIASASLMCESLMGKTIDEANQAFELFHKLLTTDVVVDEKLGKLAVLSGVREFPARVKCATLAWHTLQNALAQNKESVSTE